MIRKLLLLLVLLFCYHVNALSQGAEIYGNCFYQNYNGGRIVIRIALRNPTGSSTGQMKFVGMRFGFQYNADQLDYAGYTSYMPGLDDASYLSFIGPDTGPSPAVGFDSPSSRVAAIKTGGTKTMQRRYINRSTSVCANAISIPSNTTAILLDIYFTLKTRPPGYYHLTDPDYGFDDPEFIAQFITKWSSGGGNNKHNADLMDSYKEIAFIALREGNTDNPYQPFDASNCTNLTFNPIAIGKDDVNFITPINGVLSGKIEQVSLKNQNSGVLLTWTASSNELIESFVVEQRSETGVYEAVAQLPGNREPGIHNYQYQQLQLQHNGVLYYRIKAVTMSGESVTSHELRHQFNRPQQLELELYPNPASSQVRIHLPVSSSGYWVRIFDATGRIVYSEKIVGLQVILDVGKWTRGIYYAEAVDAAGGIRYQARFSKQ